MEHEIQVTIGEVEYLLIPHHLNLQEPGDVFDNTDVPQPLVVFVTQPGQRSPGLLFEVFKENLTIDPEVYDELNVWKTKIWTFIKGFTTASSMSPGPHIIAKGSTWQPWRVYRDFNATFSVKDNIDIAGHKTTLCNRAWQSLYPAKEKNAACVQVLIEAGAILVGKTKLQAMIMREEPHKAVEFTSPFNPRADGYQVPSGSSSGSAVGIGSYNWLNFSIGSDTNGSGRKPAQYNGCFSIRPSTGIMNTEGVVGTFPQFDMPVFFGRDLTRFPEFINVWYGNSELLQKQSQQKLRILYPRDYLPTGNQAQSRLIENFIQGLEKASEIEREEISLAEDWGKEKIAPMGQIMGTSPSTSNFLENFREEYKKQYGKPPFVQKAMRWRWEISNKVTIEERNMYWRRSEIYRYWLLDKIFQVTSEGPMSFMVLPIEEGKPDYRDDDIPPFSILSGYASLNMSPMMRAPELTTIVGHVPYESTVTDREEFLPIAASVIGAPGTDLILADLVQKGMEFANLPMKLKTGRFMY
ncbi:amidase [Penicillium malachiteum]|uniref:amidase n=1 Tax=Penicillium malachiteum TaxID=1324776 RepID=UPI002546810C|nr:amidase [Penicillium malachiteum]KAJ5715484.1 amidase [Penicillium malachiteum]